jgi:hypothetical protein
MLTRILAPRLTAPVVASLPSFAFTLAGALILSSLGASFLMPRRTALVRDVRGEDDPPLAPQAVLLLIVLCGLAMLQVPGIVSWWRAEQAVLESILPERTNHSGFDYVVMAGAYGLPAVATLTVILCALTSLLGILAPSRLASRVVAACVLLQLGYVAALFIVAAEIHAINAVLGPLLSDDPQASRTLAQWVSAHDTAAGPTLRRLAWTSLGYVGAAVIARSSSIAPAAGPTTVDVPKMPVEGAATVSRVAVRAGASGVIDESNYSVHPRMTLLEAWFTRRCTEYEIRCIPHTSRKWLSFSWATGLLKHEPAGMELVRIVPPRSPGLFLDREYEVVDALTGQGIARFIPRGADWEIADPFGGHVARVLRDSGRGFVKFRAMIGEEQVVTFKWTLAGLSTSSAQLEVEFFSSTTASLERILALAIAPILEQRARLAAEPSS